MNSSAPIVAYFQRHGTTALNDDNRFRGPLDVPLDENGLADAHRAAAFFKNIDLGDAWSSDKIRAETTAQAILEPKGMTYTPEPNFRAWDIGYLAGEKKDDHAEAIEYFQRNPDVEVPNGESLNGFKARVRPAILTTLHAGVTSGKPSLAVAHSSIIHELNHIVHGDHSMNLVKPGGIVGVQFDGKKFSTKPLLKPDTSDKPFAS